MFKYLTAFTVLFGLTPLAAASPVADPVLEELVTRALTHNRELRARGHEVEAKAEAITEARAAYLPSVTLDVRYTRFAGGLDLGDLINPVYATLNELTGQARFPTDLRLMLPIALDAKVRIAQPLYVPALGPAYRLSQLATEAERQGQRITRREIVAAVSATYYAHARAAQLADLLRQTRGLLEENLAVSTALVAASKATDDVVLRARAELAAHDQRLRVVEQGRRAAARALAVLIGAPADAAVAPTAPTANPPLPAVPPDVVPLIARARRARGEVALLGVAAQVSDEQRALARSAYLPTVAVALDLGMQRSDLGIDPDDAYAAISVVSSWNLFAGGRDRSRVRQRAHEQRAIAARAAELADRVAAEVTSAWEAAEVARAAVTTADERIASTEAAYGILARRYAASDVPQLEVLVAQSALIGARSERIVAATELHARLVELDRVIQSDGALTGAVSPIRSAPEVSP